MKSLIIIVIAAKIEVIGVAGFVNWRLLQHHTPIERRSDDVEVPILDNQSLVRAGVKDFSSMCAGCTGDPGQQPEAVGQGLNP